MIDEEILSLISAMENNTRREILRGLILDQSYAFQISRWIGVSQQAINKQLDLLEKANLILSTGMIPSSSGAPRKIYKPTGFSTLIADYSRNFIEIKRYEIPEKEQENATDLTKLPRELLDSLNKAEEELNELMERRTELVQEKDSLLGKLHIYINRISPDEMTRNILLDFCDYLDPKYVSRKYNIPISYVMQVVETYLK
ncbi:MAG: transcriptional regulator [Candidatus Thermoplasmatota archaeon]|jgi:predicted transcriptional regulator|nr:transcriptional regulator [Candidatus Thermoplasmatota archaeon]MCL5955414.1 transcriptional regulator [Candidatus Thermoplasmatota archaeon]